MRWGLARGVGFAAAIAVVAGAASLAAGPERRATLATPILALIGWYLAVGAVAGVTAGVGRPLLRRAGGAAGLGAIVGAVAFVALMNTGQASAANEPVALRDAALLGAAVGAFLGWWMRRRDMAWRGSREHDT